MPGADLFTHPAVHRLRIDISPPELERLRKDARTFVHATVTEAETVYRDVAIHLKGSVGSFRGLDDKPGLTLDFNRFNSRQRFHGLRRIHLDNSVEDPSYCNELIGSELFQAAGVPAPRVAHAVVRLNRRALGLYVLKEGFTEDFLSCHFKQVGGNLYEPGEGHDVNQHLKRNSVQAPKRDRAALKGLANAALDPDPARRWQRLELALEADRFLAFMAMEVMLCHRDGYCLARNNFRVYQDLDSGKMLFFPHGMDQLLGKPELPWRPQFAGLVARSLMETPEGSRRYRQCFSGFFTNLFQVERLTNRVDQIVAQLQPFTSGAEFVSIQNAAAVVKERLVQRRINLEAQLNQPDPKLLEFSNDVSLLTGWLRADEPAGGRMESTNSPDGTPALHIVAGAGTSASWRTKALLHRGRYRFEGRVRVAGVKPLPSGVHQGAGLRLGGSVRQTVNLTGDSAWRTLGATFQVDDATGVAEFVCELRASAGEAWFDIASLRVVRLP